MGSGNFNDFWLYDAMLFFLSRCQKGGGFLWCGLQHARKEELGIDFSAGNSRI